MKEIGSDRVAGRLHPPSRTITATVLTVLTERFALPFDDARLAMDRVRGGAVRAASGIAANEPDRVKDPLAWMSYGLELGLPVEDDFLGLPPAARAAADALLEGARRGEAPHGTEDVAVALEIARMAVASQEPGRTRLHLLLEAATSLSVAAEACIVRLGRQRCAPQGSQEWVDGVALAVAARQVTAKFASQPDPQLEERGLGLVGRIVTRLLGQMSRLRRTSDDRIGPLYPPQRRSRPGGHACGGGTG